MGPTIDNVECSLTGTCQSKPFSKFFVTLLLLATPLAAIMGALVYFIYKHLSLESQLVDYWWKISSSDIEMVDVRRKRAGGSSVSGAVDGGAGGAGSHVSSSQKPRRIAAVVTASFEIDSASGGNQRTAGSELAKTTITKATNTSGFNSSAADVCYGDISMGIYKLAKVALKPIAKFRQTRKLMIELRTVSVVSLLDPNS